MFFATELKYCNFSKNTINNSANSIFLTLF